MRTPTVAEFDQAEFLLASIRSLGFEVRADGEAVEVRHPAGMPLDAETAAQIGRLLDGLLAALGLEEFSREGGAG